MYLICGEALFDFFLESETGPGAATYAARAGGSPFNVAIGIARLGGKAALLTGLSDDMMGQRLRSVLEQEDVSTAYSVPTSRPTTLSLVGLDATGGPAYAFYGANSADTGIGLTDIPPLDTSVTGLHFGSYSIAVAPVADAFAALAARHSGLFISLDPNIRPTIEPDMAVWDARIRALLPHVDLLKISAEDIGALYPGLRHAELAQGWIDAGVTLVVITNGGEPARAWHANGFMVAVTSQAITVVDTVGAGDTFQAALLSELALRGAPRAVVRNLDEQGLRQILILAANAAAITCSRRGADLPRRAELD